MKGIDLDVPNHYAYFDTLSLSIRLQVALDQIAQLEIHLFSYLACLLSLYRGQSASEWQYDFAVTKQQPYPYSPDLDLAVRQLIRSGKLEEQDGYVTPDDSAKEDHEFLSKLSLYSSREEYLDGACSSLLVLPVGRIGSALNRDPDIQGAIALGQNRRLLTESGLDNLHRQFAALSTTLGVGVEDLMIPATVWLTYLSTV